MFSILLIFIGTILERLEELASQVQFLSDSEDSGHFQASSQDDTRLQGSVCLGLGSVSAHVSNSRDTVKYSPDMRLCYLLIHNHLIPAKQCEMSKTDP